MSMMNLTQHQASAEQRAEGVFPLPPKEHEQLVELLTFTTLPTQEDIAVRVKGISRLLNLSGYDKAMIGGAPYLMGPLTAALKESGCTVVFAYSARVSAEDPVTGIKTSTFKHLGFVQG
jgi:hypothetical protein